MLTGIISYKYNGQVYKYNALASDTSDTFALYLTSANYEAIQLMAQSDGNDDANALWERRADIKLTKINVETVVTKNQAGKKVKSPVNADLWCKLGAIIRYVKSNCILKNSVGYTGMRSASGVFQANISKDYIIPHPVTHAWIAKVTLLYGNISSIRVETDDFSIDLVNDSSVIRIFSKITDAWSSGFRFNRDYLGFDIPVPVVVSASINGMYNSLDEVIQAHPEKELEYLRGRNYQIVTDDNLEFVCDYIRGYNGLVFFDTETTGLNISFLSRTGDADQCVGIILSVKQGESFYFPLQMKSIPNLCGGDHVYCMERFLKPILEGKELVAHNMSFDWKVAYIYGINANIRHDTMAILQLTIGNEVKNYSTALKTNVKLLLGRDALELSDLVADNTWGENDIRFWDLPAELVKYYACADTDNTQALFEYLTANNYLGRYNASRVYEIEIDFSLAVAYQEFFGHLVDIRNLEVIREEIGRGQQAEMEAMEAIVGYKFNPSSPSQLTRIMYSELGIPEQRSRKTKNLTTDKETLAKLGELTNEDDEPLYPFVAHLLKYREYEGVRKIIDKFPEHMTEDGYLFSKVMQYGTTTGRVSINTPNYQSYNDPIKKNVIPREGYWMFDTDYSSVEYRILGSMVGNKAIIEAFKDPDFDYHTYQAARMNRVPYANVTKKMRKHAKGVNFGLPYGMGDKSLGLSLFGEANDENTRKAFALKQAYFKGQEDIRDWFEAVRDGGVRNGYTETYFGRRRYYRREDFDEPAIRRQAGNHVIQGCIQGDILIHDRYAGTVKIKDLAGYWAEVWDGTGWTESQVLYAGKKRKCIVRFKGGMEFVCSPEHQFLVRSHRGNDRFVPCKDLKFGRNASRVVLSQDFIQSDISFRSDRDKYITHANNSNNVVLQDIGSDFEIGVFLGRLASDGSVFVRNDGSDYVKQIVAEHELDVYDYLSKISASLNPVCKVNEVRKDRNERIANVTIYSSSLTKEILDLDIRHKIDDKIFACTETLRGFLRGMFDGDGGISGNTITLVQGVQDDFSGLMKDIQKALLFFGIRSNYRYYEGDRYVLQIKTMDNDRFLDVIGFINKEKQEKGRTLVCNTDEHIFGKCLMVESVEITDEDIDMYDVCNTSGGYYVANGVVTHNTAADIYKLAVGRVFRRICKEGWLGDVLLTAFVHDELLGEVANHINPGVFLKALREEFEVVVADDWAPLYMGFGYGMNWYEAKSVELPIKLQWEIVDKYGITGFPNWNGNGREFCDRIPALLRDFEIRDITKQITAEESRGKEIKPALNTQLLDICKKDSELWTEYLDKYIKEGLTEDKSAYLNRECNIQCFVAGYEPKGKHTTQSALDQFCILHGVDRSMVNLLDIPEVDITQADEVATSGTDFIDFEGDGADKQKAMDVRVDTLGMYVDTEEKRVILLYPTVAYLRFIESKVNRREDGYSVVFKDTYGLISPNEKGKLYETPAYLASSEIQTIQSLYLQFFNQGGIKV